MFEFRGDEIQRIVGQFRDALEQLAMVEGDFDRLRHVTDAYNTIGPKAAYLTARSVDGAMRLVVALRQLLVAYDEIFRDETPPGRAFRLQFDEMAAGAGVDGPSIRDKMRAEYFDAMVGGELENVNLFGLRPMLDAIEEVRLGLQ